MTYATTTLTLTVSVKPTKSVSDELRRVEVRIALATWMDGSAARWPQIWSRAGLLARTWITWRGSQRVGFNATEIKAHSDCIAVRQLACNESVELVDFLVVSDVVRQRTS